MFWSFYSITMIEELKGKDSIGTNPLFKSTAPNNVHISLRYIRKYCAIKAKFHKNTKERGIMFMLCFHNQYEQLQTKYP